MLLYGDLERIVQQKKGHILWLLFSLKPTCMSVHVSYSYFNEKFIMIQKRHNNVFKSFFLNTKLI